MANIIIKSSQFSEYLDLLTVLTFIVAFLSYYKLVKDERNRNLLLLKAIFQQLDNVSISAKTHKEHLEDKTFPSWRIPNIDLNYYLSRIPHKLRQEWGLRNVSTRKLKKELIQIHNKVSTINNIYDRIFNVYIETESIKGTFLNELLTNTYYADLELFIEDARNELKTILIKCSSI